MWGDYPIQRCSTRVLPARETPSSRTVDGSWVSQLGRRICPAPATLPMQRWQKYNSTARSFDVILRPKRWGKRGLLSRQQHIYEVLTTNGFEFCNGRAAGVSSAGGSGR